jgi:hypothetical protein
LVDPDAAAAEADDDDDDDDDAARRYRALSERLTALAQQRDRQQRRLASYRHLHALLEPFTNARETVQPNLVTRDGELAKELERMRVLLARVTGRVEEIKRAGLRSHAEGAGAASNEQKLAAVMDLNLMS